MKENVHILLATCNKNLIFSSRAILFSTDFYDNLHDSHECLMGNLWIDAFNYLTNQAFRHFLLIHCSFHACSLNVNNYHGYTQIFYNRHCTAIVEDFIETEIFWSSPATSVYSLKKKDQDLLLSDAMA